MTETVAASRVRTRDISIDTLRGLAIILMVAGHVIGSTGADGMEVAADSPWRHYYDLFADLRMPLFTALSGFVYALRPLRDPAGYRRFAWGKTRRLIVPLVTVGTLFVVMQTVALRDAGSGASDVWRLYVYGSGHFWFLQAIFLIFLLVGVLDAFGVLRSPARVGVAIGLSAAVYIVVRIPAEWDIFSISGAIRLLPFFLLGYGIHLYWRGVTARWVLLGLTAVLFVAKAGAVFDVYSLERPVSAALSVALGLAGISTLLLFRGALAWGPLARLGYFSFAIYLLHVFGTAPTRMALQRFGVESDIAVFVICLVAGLALPVIFEITSGRIRWISWTFLGQRPYRGVPQ